MFSCSSQKSVILILIVSTILILTCMSNVNAERLSLDECIAIAKKANPDIRSADNSYKISKGRVWSSYGGLLPRLNSWLDGTRSISGPSDYSFVDQNSGRLVGGTTGISKSINYSAGISLQQTLFDGGSNIYNVYDAKAAAEARRYNLIGTERDIIYQVKENYFSLLKSKMLLDVRDEAVKRGEEQLKIAQSRYELGSASLSDVLKAKVQYGNDKLDRVEAENSYLLAKANLNYILNRDVNLDIEPIEEFDIREVEYNLETAMNTAMERNPNLLESEYALKSAKHQKNAARGDWFPTFSIGASYSWGNEEFSEIKNLIDQDYRWTLNGTINFPIFDGFQRNANYNSAKYSYRTAEDSYYTAKNSVALEIKQAFLNLDKARENLKLTEESQDAAKEDFNLAQEKYNLGAATILDLIDAQVSFKQAETNRIQSLFDYNLAVSQLEKAMGL
ncbi:MAG: TolC family protein [candidate division Zixibacteria bacterium]|nr:TolC family protein [candidate division Zixibacteria bacterium]